MRRPVGRLPPDPADPFAAPAPTPIDDVGAIRALLVAAAEAEQVLTYSGFLARLGHRFTRPKMRLLCRTLGQVDTAARVRGEPELAVLVVRATDRLPGSGWWEDGQTARHGYEGPLSGPEAARFVHALQKEAFTYWRRMARDGGQSA